MPKHTLDDPSPRGQVVDVSGGTLVDEPIPFRVIRVSAQSNHDYCQLQRGVGIITKDLKIHAREATGVRVASRVRDWSSTAGRLSIEFLHPPRAFGGRERGRDPLSCASSHGLAHQRECQHSVQTSGECFVITRWQQQPGPPRLQHFPWSAMIGSNHGLSECHPLQQDAPHWFRQYGGVNDDVHGVQDRRNVGAIACQDHAILEAQRRNRLQHL